MTHIPVDFTADSEIVRSIVEGERLSYGHLYNRAFATEISQIDPLPHQRIAVYDHMLKQPRLRFLLADDAGAGKTIMAGLYIREMSSRCLIQRVLIVPPAGLVGNWHRELQTLFALSFRIISGEDAKTANPFAEKESHLAIVSVDTLAGDKMFRRLQEAQTIPYDLVIFDEAHKLSASRGGDRKVRKTGRYRLGEALAGLDGLPKRWCLRWRCRHLLLLTATPHMGRDYPYYALWKLLEPGILSTPEAFDAFPQTARRCHFIRRTKEEMLTLDGKPLYPVRISDTLGYELSRGDIGEQRLYEETTEYLRTLYNRAKLLNRSAVRLAMGVFQRRLASSTHALMRSFERRVEKLDSLIEQVETGRLTLKQLETLQSRLDEEEKDIFDSKTADEESEGGREENEAAEERLLQGVIAGSLEDLRHEREQVEGLLELARKVDALGMESKFERLREVANDPRYRDEKLLIFTEHRDTLDYLADRLAGLGYTGRVARIYGGMHYTRREEQAAFFRKPSEQGGARFLVATDAAGEGINLQFCWIMINYDVPWNPARLEQRMGRIHRYGQKHDPVIILNLVAAETREGKVIKTLLDKLEKIRKELRSDKVFDVIGRVFAEISIKEYMEQALTEDAAGAAARLEGCLTGEQVEALAEKEKSLYGKGGDIKQDLPRLAGELKRESYARLLPGYVRRYVEKTAPLLGLGFAGDLNGSFSFVPENPDVQSLERDECRSMTFYRPAAGNDLWFHPGAPVFEDFRRQVSATLGDKALQGGIFIDPAAAAPYLIHIALVSVARRADPAIDALVREEILESRLAALRQAEDGSLSECELECLLLLQAGQGLPVVAHALAVTAEKHRQQAHAWLLKHVAGEMAERCRQKSRDSLEERQNFIQSGFDFQEAELAAARAKYAGKARAGNRKAREELERIKAQQRALSQQCQRSLAPLRREPELIAPAAAEFIAHALVAPSVDPADREKYAAEVEQIAMQAVRAYEEAEGAEVRDVHTPALARAAGLGDNPGFDLLSVRPAGEERAIEVKGRTRVGHVDISANEWAKACNLGKKYWLYVVFNCATPNPDLRRVSDPFAKLLAEIRGVQVTHQNIFAAAEKT
ncbi:MAG: DUF3883 domain-containing protein [Gammaproteobacteria bacterium]|nr:DUF3883 domain-containing protein [Gammaproteobacteria bacterium]